MPDLATSGQALSREDLQQIMRRHRCWTWSQRCSCGERLLDDVCPELLLLVNAAITSAVRSER